MFKIALNAGHYLKTSGKRCMKSIDPNETREWVLNNRICEKITKILSDYEGYELLRIDDPTGKTDTKLKARTDKANKWGAHIWVSIHHNAGVKGGKGGGIVAYVHPRADVATLEWQSAFYKGAIKYTKLVGNRSTPLAKSDLHECRETSMPAVLLEMGFMDSTTDTPIILTEEFADNAAKGIAEVLIAKCGLTKKVVKVETPKTETKAEEVYVVQKGDNLSKIAKKYNTTYQKLAAYNNIANPSRIYVGQKIKIPSGNAVATPAVTTPKVTYFKKYTGTSSSIIDAMKAIGENSSFTFRSKVAKANGIKLYVGTASQNSTMVKLLKQGKLIKP